METFKERLKDLREEKELSQRELGRSIGVENTNIARWENGTQDITSKNIIKLALFFDVTAGYLLGLEN